MISVREIEDRSLAARVGFRQGDRILTVNGEEIRDLIDFQVHSADPKLLFEVEREGEVYTVEVDRIHREKMGIHFDEMRLRRCNNKCVFCFLHQMPKGLRRSLYFEDDDYRLSFLHGSYVTLTNMRDIDLHRIIEQRLSPQYISVHATDPFLRQQLLGRRKPTVPILDRIRLLAEHGIEMHAQVVICPGINDGSHLKRTVRDLADFYPGVRSVALVPIGLTRFRSHLPSLRQVTPQLAVDYLGATETWGLRFVDELGERFVYAADELFLIGGHPLPQIDYYDSFPQIENGIGMVRTFLDRWERGKSILSDIVDLSAGWGTSVRIALVTGTLAARFLAPIVEELKASAVPEATLVPVENDFFGHGITVSGLLTGRDIIAALKGRPHDLAVLPPNCINGDGLTIDDMTIADLATATGIQVSVGEYDLARGLGKLLGEGRTRPLVRSLGDGRQLSELGFFVRSGGPGRTPEDER